MTFWLISGALALVVLALTLAPLLRERRARGDDPAAYDIAVYRDQLSEVERDLARGVISEEVAARTRVEVSRRILEADKSAGQVSHGRAPRWMTGVMIGTSAVVIVVGSFLFYDRIGAPGYGDLPLQARLEAAETLRENRPDQATAEASAFGRLPPPAVPDAQYGELMDRLREAVVERQDDLRGFELLAQNEASLGNFAAAHAAKARVIELKGGGATASDYADLTDMLVLAAAGYVSPEAEAALTEALARDPSNGAARYYQGLMFLQTGRPDIAFGVWRRLLESSAPDAPWVPALRAQIGDAAFRAGQNYDLPPLGAAPVAPMLPGPDQGQIEAAGAMSMEERMAMIEGMVEGLSERLATEGGTPAEWGRLVTALRVMGQSDRAYAIWQEALQVFADNPGALDTINRAAEQAGFSP
ncbi:MAG: c-type cytochrome biogenesis protein CcmI [Pseudomonadota bacterium]